MYSTIFSGIKIDSLDSKLDLIFDASIQYIIHTIQTVHT